MGFLIKKTMTAYSEKLKNPKWQRKRLEALNRDNFTCQHCKDTETELHVHHLKYKKEPFDADLEDLVTLCKDCHYIETYFIKESKVVFNVKFKEALICNLDNGYMTLFFLKNGNPEHVMNFAPTSAVLKKMYELNFNIDNG